jgi:hypothetical protein
MGTIFYFVKSSGTEIFIKNTTKPIENVAQTSKLFVIKCHGNILNNTTKPNWKICANLLAFLK